MLYSYDLLTTVRKYDKIIIVWLYKKSEKSERLFFEGSEGREGAMKETVYRVNIPRLRGLGKSLCFALVSDLHNEDPSEAIAALERRRPDYILMPGDIFELLDGTMQEKSEGGFALMSACASIAPTFYSIGNHENGGTGSWVPGWDKKTGKHRAISAENAERIKESGAILLDDSFVLRDGIAFAGLTSGLSNDAHEPRTDWLRELCAVDGPKILLCHHPEYYTDYGIKDMPIDLIVSGHAHGGQWRFFGRGVYAPGQGLFPKYTSGVHDGKFVISTGLKKSRRIPRLFNEPELVFIENA